MGRLSWDRVTYRKADLMTPHRFRAELCETVRQFTPNWFTVTMGTGILSLALNQFPVPLPGVHALGEALWWLNMGLFVLFGALYASSLGRLPARS